MRRMGQVRPVAVEVLDHVHEAVLELPAQLGAHDVRLHRGVGRPGLASHLEARLALLLADIGPESRPVDVEDHGQLLLLVTGGPQAPRSPVGWSWQPWTRLPSDRVSGRHTNGVIARLRAGP